MVTSPRFTRELAELHFHLGLSVEPHILWSIAHEQGIKLPTKDYWDFFDMIRLNKPHITWEDYHKLFHWTERIQSSPKAMERSVYETITGAYRVNNTTLQELGFNPIYRNRGGEHDLDQIILAALRGMELALIEFPQVRAGLIFFLDRRLPYEINEIIIKKAIKYRHRGVVGIDIAGPHKDGFHYKDYNKLYHEALDAGLHTSSHTGEDGTVEEMEHVLDVLPLQRVNHGIKAAQSPKLMKLLVERNITLCICPTSNLSVGFVKDLVHLKEIVQTLWKNTVKFCINTDNPAMLKTSLSKEIKLLEDNNILTSEQIDQTVRWAFEATFINLPNKDENLYL